MEVVKKGLARKSKGQLLQEAQDATTAIQYLRGWLENSRQQRYRELETAGVPESRCKEISLELGLLREFEAQARGHIARGRNIKIEEEVDE